jgi:hypothetical protein
MNLWSKWIHEVTLTNKNSRLSTSVAMELVTASSPAVDKYNNISGKMPKTFLCRILWHVAIEMETLHSLLEQSSNNRDLLWIDKNVVEWAGLQSITYYEVRIAIASNWPLGFLFNISNISCAEIALKSDPKCYIYRAEWAHAYKTSTPNRELNALPYDFWVHTEFKYRPLLSARPLKDKSQTEKFWSWALDRASLFIFWHVG